MFITPVFGNAPGMQAAVATYENQFSWGGPNRGLIKGEIIDKDTVDSGASPSTARLRPGLIVGKITTTGKVKQYSDTATDGSQVAYGVLLAPFMMTDNVTNATVDKFWGVLVGGPVRAAALLGLTQKARGNMYGRFVFDDDVPGNTIGWHDVVAKTTNYEVKAADNNLVFTNQGAGQNIIFTLPTIAKGLRYRFFVETGYNLTIASAVPNTLVTFNDATASTIAFDQANELIGGAFEVVANADATKWLVFVYLGKETQTPTIV